MKVNIKKISEITGFSQATVSNALNNKKGVNKETAEKIIQAAKDIGYLTEQKINGIKLVIYKTNGSIVNDSPFFSSLISGIEAESRSFGLNTIFYNLDRSDPEYDIRMNELLNDPSSAMLVLATELEESEAEKLQSAMVPVLILDSWYEYLDFNAVLIDNTDAACKAVNYLIKMGHQKIGHLRGNYEIKNFYYRRQGFRRALKENGLAYNPAYTFALTPSMEGAQTEMEAFLDQKPQLPTAFFADNDMIALGAMRALQIKGYRIPEDISMIGFDDLPFCTISDPPLTTIHVYNYQMGCASVRRLMEMAQNEEDYKAKIQICSAFVERSSVLNICGKTDKEDKENGI